MLILYIYVINVNNFSEQKYVYTHHYNIVNTRESSECERYIFSSEQKMSNKHLFQKCGFLRAPFAIGVGRYVCQLQRVTLKFCKSHGASLGAR